MRQGDLADVLEAGHVSPVLGNGQAVPTIVFHGDRDTTVHPRNGDHVIARSMQITNSRKTVHRGRVPEDMPIPERSIRTRAAAQSLSIGRSMEPDTHGRAAAPPAPTPIREGRTPRGDAALLPRALTTHSAAVRIGPDA
jgi:Esterase PHB depolymerase.